jgi:pimeloyl-ACP methyl ester carboxylesterase
MPFAKVTDGRLFYELYGEGRPLVLIHSAGASHAWWRWQIPDLSRNYRIVSYDVRGHGQSTPLERTGSVDGFSDDLQTLLNHIRIKEPVLIGWSMGGMIAMQNCLNLPSSVNALILIATSGHRIPGLKSRVYINYLQSLLNLLADFTQPRKFDRSAQQFPRQNVWLELQIRKMLSATASKDVFDWVLRDIRENPRENYFKVIKSLWNWEAGDKLRRIKVPTLILAGQNDTLVPARFSRMLHDIIPNSKLRVFENAGHYLVLEQPALVNAEILKFLESIG